MKKSLYEDLTHNPRTSESSLLVAATWDLPADNYLTENPEVTIDNEELRTNYFALTAERFLYRRKLLSLPIDVVFAKSEAMLSAQPFGKTGPDFATLSDPSVRMAMAFVPLTPNGGNDKAVLARLYCVEGLSPCQYGFPFKEGGDSDGIKNFAWFIAGVPDRYKSLVGRSWLLSAHLLMKILAERDVEAARNLVNHFIVTGDVVDGVISSIEMGRKADLAKKYKNYRWILPFKNRKEFKEMKAEYPKTLEEAYELIRSMRDCSTAALIGTVSSGDGTKAIPKSLMIGADPSHTDSVTGQNARQMFKDAIFIKKIAEIKHEICNRLKENSNVRVFVEDALDRLTLQFERLLDYDRIMSYYGDIPQMFFMLAKAGRRDLVNMLADICDINATDLKGETALDFAEEFNEVSVANMLRLANAERRGIYELKSDKMRSAIRNLFSLDNSERTEALSYVKEAIEQHKCSPNAIFNVSTIDSDNGYIVLTDRWAVNEGWSSSQDDESAAEHEYSFDKKHYVRKIRLYSLTLYGIATYFGFEDLLKACMSCGIDADVQIDVAMSRAQLEEETFETSLRDTIKHECNFSDDDFISKEKLTIRELSNTLHPSEEVS